ncbi:MAG: hypothetical protein RLZZ540_2016 [Bacteroidota bacterium]|jgi:hypothetical protein
MDLNTAEFIRVGTSYYAIVERPTISGSSEKVMIPWSKETLIMDLGREAFLKIKKYYGFVCLPQHIEFQREVGDFYNIYHPLDFNIDRTTVIDYKDLESKLDYTFKHLKHIFGSQFELGLDYLKILLEKPQQILPVVCLVSNERETGKSLFPKFLRRIFSFNATYSFAESFINNFNGDIYGKLLLLVEEVVSDNQQVVEKIKYLSTADKNKFEKKGQDRVEGDAFFKIVLTSNFETTFIKISPDETRFWVRKIPSIVKDPDFEKKLFQEIPDFLNYLIRRPYSSIRKTRMWFTPEQIRTKALLRLMNNESDLTKYRVLGILREIHESFDVELILIAPKELSMISKKMHHRNFVTINEARNVLKNFGFVPTSNSFKYLGYEYLSHGEFVTIDRVGRYYSVDYTQIEPFFDENDEG